MATTISDSAPTATTPRVRSILTPLMLVGLLLSALIFAPPVVAGLINGHVPPPPLIITIADLIAFGVVATRWRWASVIALLASGLTAAIELSPGFPQYQLTHPAAFSPFATFVGHLTVNLIVVVASVAALIQAIRKQAPHNPRWLAPALSGVVCLALGALLVGATGHYSGAGGAGSTAAGTEVVHLTADTFAPNIIALHQGDTLTVVDDVSVPHILTNGTWSASGQAQPGAESGAPTINNVQVNNNTVTLGPFTTPGTYHIFCIVHPGMNLTIIVQ